MSRSRVHAAVRAAALTGGVGHAGRRYHYYPKIFDRHGFGWTYSAAYGIGLNCKNETAASIYCRCGHARKSRRTRAQPGTAPPCYPAALLPCCARKSRRTRAQPAACWPPSHAHRGPGMPVGCHDDVCPVESISCARRSVSCQRPSVAAPVSGRERPRSPACLGAIVRWRPGMTCRRAARRRAISPHISPYLPHISPCMVQTCRQTSCRGAQAWRARMASAACLTAAVAGATAGGGTAARARGPSCSRPGTALPCYPATLLPCYPAARARGPSCSQPGSLLPSRTWRGQPSLPTVTYRHLPSPTVGSSSFSRRRSPPPSWRPTASPPTWRG